MIKQKEIRVYDYCKEEISGETFFKMEDVPYEGCSILSYNKKCYDFTDKDFCSFECFTNDVKEKLKIGD